MRSSKVRSPARATSSSEVRRGISLCELDDVLDDDVCVGRFGGSALTLRGTSSRPVRCGDECRAVVGSLAWRRSGEVSSAARSCVRRRSWERGASAWSFAPSDVSLAPLDVGDLRGTLGGVVGAPVLVRGGNYTRNLKYIPSAASRRGLKGGGMSADRVGTILRSCLRVCCGALTTTGSLSSGGGT